MLLLIYTERQEKETIKLIVKKQLSDLINEKMKLKNLFFGTKYKKSSCIKEPHLT